MIWIFDDCTSNKTNEMKQNEQSKILLVPIHRFEGVSRQSDYDALREKYPCCISWLLSGIRGRSRRRFLQWERNWAQEKKPLRPSIDRDRRREALRRNRSQTARVDWQSDES